MNTQIQNTSNRLPALFGFGSRLLLAFSLVAAMTVVAGLVAWIAFGSLGNVINQIEDQNFPAITLSAELAEKGAAVVATAPLLIAAKTETEQADIWSNLRVLLREMAQLTKELSHYSDSREAMEQLNISIDRITDNLIKLDFQIRQKLLLSEQISEKADRLRWVHADFLDEVDPMVADARFNLESAMEKIKLSPVPVKNHAQFNVFKKESTKQEAILKVNALGNLSVGLLVRGSSAPDMETLNDTVHFHGEVAALLERDLSGLKGLSSAISLRQVTREIISFGKGEDGLFSMRKKQLAALIEGYRLLERNRALVGELRAIIATRVNAAKTASVSAMKKSERLANQGKLMLLGAMVASLLVAILVGWFYVGRNLVARITNLSKSMQSIAGGNLQAPIQTGGRDEISSMAQSLLIFRNTAIEMEEANVQALIDNAQVGLITTDMNGRIEFFNPTAMALFGYHDANRLSNNFEELITGDNLKFIKEFFQKSSDKDDKILLAMEVIGKQRDGNRVPIDISIRGFKQRQKKKYIITLYDLTERKQAELILEQRVRKRTNDLYQANEDLQHEIKERQNAQTVLQEAQAEFVQAGKLAALGKMAAGIAHELNQPLTAIRSYTHNMGRLFELGRTDEAINILDRITSLIERMTTISRNLTNIARLPRKNIDRILLQPILNQAIGLFQEQIQKQKVTLKINMPKRDIQVLGEKIPLEQVFTNLISNALDAMKECPKQRLTIKVSTREQQGEACITFTDTGKGMSKKELYQIFDPFYTTKEVGKGLGLGLSISYNIIKDWQGSLKALSEPEKGASFVLILKTE
ncbi:MAG: PAS domain S-box protein [Desulfobacula sp.]|uniref:ATP-binding protein n=1 Tax=Desulfobacula sp. TaxID=2593537 RepID=UPI0025BFC4F6|nr:ATP-binding protein [Desulfobacula sp.]MCD4721163.1 PAS domain S-box protein [Desulfobacula sp.]